VNGKYYPVRRTYEVNGKTTIDIPLSITLTSPKTESSEGGVWGFLKGVWNAIVGFVEALLFLPFILLIIPLAIIVEIITLILIYFAFKPRTSSSK